MIGLILLAVCISASTAVSVETKSVVVTTSMLECAVREAVPGSEGIEIVRLLPPSACPGHFDLSPRVLPELRAAVLVLRHDYQDFLDRKLTDMGASNVSMIEIPTAGSPLIPSNYTDLVKQVRTWFVSAFPGAGNEPGGEQQAVVARTNDLSRKMKNSAGKWQGKPVIAAVNQKEFLEWLGFTVAGVLERPEDTSPRDIEKLLSVKAEIIVANYQEGMQGAMSLGKRMNIPVAVLSNFPGVDGYGEDYYQLLEENIRKLEEAWRKR